MASSIFRQASTREVGTLGVIVVEFEEIATTCEIPAELDSVSLRPLIKSTVPNQFIVSMLLGLKGTETPADVTSPSNDPSHKFMISETALLLSSSSLKSASISAWWRSMPITLTELDSSKDLVDAPMPEAEPVIAIVLNSSPKWCLLETDLRPNYI